MHQKERPIKQIHLIKIEFRRLTRLYYACIYSFRSTKLLVKQELSSGEIDPSSEITLAEDTDEIVARSPIELFKKIDVIYPKILRETLLVRAISQMENFLVSILPEIAERDLLPFKSQEKIITFNQSQLLSFNSIEDIKNHVMSIECRSLNGKSFREFEKYYSKKLGINFSSSPIPPKEIDEIYAIRHLLVHSGGIVDKKFVSTFAPKMKPGEKIDVSEIYFIESMKKLESFAAYCAESANLKYSKLAPSYCAMRIEELLKKSYEKIEQVASAYDSPEAFLLRGISAKFSSQELLENHFSDRSEFNFGKERFPAKEIIAGTTVHADATADWIVFGKKSIVGAYLSYISYLSRHGSISGIEIEKLVFSRELSRVE